MNEHELLEELRMADPAPTGAERPAGTWSSSVVLQTIERRSGTMQTVETNKPAQPPARRRRVIAAVAALAVAIAVGAVAVAVLGGSDEPDVASLEVTGTFTGDACRLEGPLEFAQGDRVTFTFINDTSDVGWGYEIWSVPEGTTAADIDERGVLDVVLEAGSGIDGSLGGDTPPTFRGQRYSITRTLGIPGPHAFICIEKPSRDSQYAAMFTVTGN
ncbi:MAG: hypothetical protein HKN74_07560 [Acidimicrobiia bacterium]|nr:hypothetical protein [Acidimicrobiia bacterium]NNF10123.1 hypothetical protein [Acidimicrobiia bacterium]NNL70669.1 hypothetical protein [Acidimicrobiia bacterium]